VASLNQTKDSKVSSEEEQQSQLLDMKNVIKKTSEHDRHSTPDF
jgi:hypothetical protein